MWITHLVQVFNTFWWASTDNKGKTEEDELDSGDESLENVVDEYTGMIVYKIQRFVIAQEFMSHCTCLSVFLSLIPY
jgi:hypothetical protein